jgi:5-deoxy-glucuronate isomerase
VNVADLHLPAGSLARGNNHLVDLSPQRAGWQFSGLQVLRLAPGEPHELELEGIEAAVLPLGGSVTVEVDGQRLELGGRADVFERVTDWAYLPVGAEARLTATAGCEVAIPTAVAERRFDAVRIPAGDVAVEVRGAGPATRQVTNFCSPEAFDGADRLMCVELLTPDGNWSSYPPHKHDDSPECPVQNEEIYYFRLGRVGMRGYAADGFGFHRTYTEPDHEDAFDVNVPVGDGDVFLIPRGYHGPCVAAPGYPMYYLNVLAGPGGGRSMAFCDDPAHHWVRDGWERLAPDPRCPMATAEGLRAVTDVEDRP